MKALLRIFFLVLPLLFSGCRKQTVPVAAPAGLPQVTLFSPASPFNTPIPENPEIDPNSDKMRESLIKEAEDRGFFIALKSYSETVYFTGPETPVYDVVLTASWAPKRKLLNVPIPDYALADPSVDGEMVIIDTLNGCEYDFWQIKKIYGKWYASWGNALPIDGSGIFEKGMSARGCGFALAAGILWPHEFKNHAIGHALVFTYDYTKSGGPVSPATESDGTSNTDIAIPEGALVQLNPGLDLGTLGLTDYEYTIAVALQQYGMYLSDDGGGLELEAVNPLSFSGNLYEGLLPDVEYVPLDNIPVSEFRVLKLSPQDGTSEPQIVPNSCAEFR
ncbi:MAG: hypothetical protein L3J66_05045 [Bacteroidales bacterium]|nr:hypothetical protein [Bacteroidales bacterium]